MKKFLAFLLATLLVLSMAACGGEAAAPVDTTPDTTPLIVWQDDNFPYPKMNNHLTWDDIEAFPIKTQDMTVQEMRELCVAFMNFSKTATYTINDYLEFEKSNSGSRDQMVKGQVYAGLPYIGGGGCGNVYRLMDYMNPETGVLDMEYIKLRPNLFGGHCSSSTYWAWGRVISSVEHAYTFNITHTNGYLRVGSYTYQDGVSFGDNYTTTMIVKENGMDVMCESYAQLHLADGLVNYLTGGGHVIMVTSEPVIAYLSDGKIDPYNSYLTITDQHQGWIEYTTEAGDVCQLKANVNKKMNFLQLYESSYMPFTFAEFLGTKGVDETECAINIQGESVEPLSLFNAKVTSNFGISDIYLSLYNASGREVYRLVTRATEAGVKSLNIAKNATSSFSWGDFKALSGEYTVKVSAQLSTGERPELYTGKVTIQQN